MSNRCPLTDQGDEGNWSTSPGICLTECGDAMQRALDTTAGAENYDDCGHGAMLDVTKEMLRAIGSGAQREYVIVEACQECNTEVIDTTYEFGCVAGE